MFSKVSRKDFSWSRSKKALPVFLLLLTGGLLLSLVYLLSIRSHLHSIERGEAERLLDTYLASHRASRNMPGSFHLQDDRLPKELIFVRMVQGDEQILIAGDQFEDVSFKGLIDFPPTSTGVWVKLPGRKSLPVFTITTKEFAGGVLVQAGKDGSTGYNLYCSLIAKTAYIFLASGLILWLLSLYFIRLSISPLVVTRRQVAELTRHSTTELLPEQGSGPELDNLYYEINQVIRQNRHLVSEMQNSLDNVAHDLRTPMTRLRSVAEYGLQEGDNTLLLREALSDCLEESERVLSMLKIMMSVAEAESGTMRLEYEECDLAKSLRRVIALYEYVAAEKNIDVQLETTTLPLLHLDSTRIAQVWANLLDNAIKYGEEGGWVKISTRVVEDSVVVSFSDNGMGISENEQSKIWERLYRGDRSRSQRGLGLGLNYVQAVVVAHGGSVRVSSKLHGGSLFMVWLPV